MGFFSFIRKLFGGGGAKEREPLSLVLLLRQTRSLDKETLNRLARECLGAGIEIVEQPPPDFGPNAKIFLFECKGSTFAVQCIPEPYDDFSGLRAPQMIAAHVEKVLDEQKAWISVDLIVPGEGMNRARAYEIIGKLIAELAGDDCLALYSMELRCINIYSSELKEPLRSENPLDAFKVLTVDPLFSISPDDPRMKEATEEARRRWPEFVQAFEHRTEREQFAVKAVFREGEEKEHIWIEVDGISPNGVTGTIANECLIVKNVKEGDNVSPPLTDIDDWMISKGDDIINGGFTTKVLMEKSIEK